MRDLPLPGRRVAEEAAGHAVVHAATGHRRERLVQRGGELGVAEATVLVQDETEHLRLRELRLAAEPAELRVVLPAHERGDAVDDL